MFFKKDKKKEFWKWFVKNKSKFEVFITTKSRTDFSLYHELSRKIKKVNEEIIPELTMEEEKYVLIISCGGISAGIKSVQELAASAPEINNWIVKKFRQPTDKITLNYEGLELEMSDLQVDYDLDMDREKVNIVYKIKGYEESDKRYTSLGFLYLDHILGEFNVMTRVGYIDFEPLRDLEPKLIGLVELRNLIEDKLY